MKIILFWICILVFSFSVSAQPPQAFNYQGIARDGSGSPLVNTNISLRIAILQGAFPGTEVYKENHHVQTNKLGLFAIEVGHGTSQIGLFNAISWGSGDHYVRVEMDPAGGTNFTPLGESQLLSVPYALFAGNGAGGENLWLENARGIHYMDGNVGIGTDRPVQNFSIEGNDPTGDERTYVNLSNLSTSNRSFVSLQLTSGQPDTYTTLQHLSETYDYDGDKYTDFGQLESNGHGLILRASANHGIIKFLAGGGVLSPVERMRISNIGYVGIGTENPVSRVQVTDGDVYIEDIDNGVIMKSPNGTCWRLTINDDGSVKTTSISCPN